MKAKRLLRRVKTAKQGMPGFSRKKLTVIAFAICLFVYRVMPGMAQDFSAKAEQVASDLGSAGYGLILSWANPIGMLVMAAVLIVGMVTKNVKLVLSFGGFVIIGLAALNLIPALIEFAQGIGS